MPLVGLLLAAPRCSYFIVKLCGQLASGGGEVDKKSCVHENIEGGKVGGYLGGRCSSTSGQHPSGILRIVVRA